MSCRMDLHIDSGRLIGGLLVNNTIEKEFAFGSLTGEVELKIEEARKNANSMSTLVTNLLETALVNLGGLKPNKDIVNQLCVADRQYLIRQFSRHIDSNQVWLSSNCVVCGERFDFQVNQSELPFKTAGKGFPYLVVNTQHGLLKFRVPTAKDIEQIADMTGEMFPIRKLLQVCYLSDEKDSIEELDEQEIDLIESELEKVSPEVTEIVSVQCPECQKMQNIMIDPYICLHKYRTSIYQDINKLAKAYHWSEKDILNLPRSRRKLYLDMIS